MYVYAADRILLEAVAAIICFILVRFMIKPYRLTSEKRYLGLPLGFAFLGISFTLSAIAYSQIGNLALVWVQFFTRTFAFVFIATTYMFSKRDSKKGQLIAEITISLLTVALAAILIVVFVDPKYAYLSYLSANVYIRIFNLICLCYISLYTLRSHVKNADPSTIWIPLSFIFLAISQYSLLFWYLDASSSALAGSLFTRYVGLAIFLFIAYRSFYSVDKKERKIEDSVPQRQVEDDATQSIAAS